MAFALVETIESGKIYTCQLCNRDTNIIVINYLPRVIETEGAPLEAEVLEITGWQTHRERHHSNTSNCNLDSIHLSGY